MFFHILVLTNVFISFFIPFPQISVVESQLADFVLFNLNSVHLYLEEVGDP